MTVGIMAVQARIQAIEARFGVPAGFAAALSEAGGTAMPPPAPTGGGSRTAPAALGRPGVTSGAVHGAHGLAPVPATARWLRELPAAARPFVDAIGQAAVDAGVDPRMLAALAWTESGFAPSAVSRAGAVGLAQLMPATADGLGVDPWDPAQNLTGGARYLRQQLERFGSPALALAAYNAGPGRVEQAGGVPPFPETQAYVARVLDRYDRLVDAS